MKNIIRYSMIGILACTILLEATVRWGIGLGTPPLSISHPTIEYMFAPNQDLQRFGNRQLYNDKSMRSPSLATVGERELVLVFGDSVLNGGNLTDHADLATTLATDESVFYANISAGSWGPGNHRAYIDAFGLFDAHAVLFLYSSHDLNDQPKFKPLNPATHPTNTPWSAIGELMFRYLPRYLPDWLSVWPAPTNTSALRLPQPLLPTGAEDLETMFVHLASLSVPTCIMLHPTQTELAHNFEPGKKGLISIASKWSIPVVDLAPRYTAFGNYSSLYRPNDGIHINTQGQQLLTETIRECGRLAAVPFR